MGFFGIRYLPELPHIAIFSPGLTRNETFRNVGIMFSLVLTLFVIPAMYSYMSTAKARNQLEIIEEEDRKLEIQSILSLEL